MWWFGELVGVGGVLDTDSGDCRGSQSGYATLIAELIGNAKNMTEESTEWIECSQEMY